MVSVVGRVFPELVSRDFLISNWGAIPKDLLCFFFFNIKNNVFFIVIVSNFDIHYWTFY